MWQGNVEVSMRFSLSNPKCGSGLRKSAATLIVEPFKWMSYLNAFFIDPDFGYIWITVLFPVVDVAQPQCGFFWDPSNDTGQRSDAANKIRLARIVRPLFWVHAHNWKTNEAERKV